MNKRRMSGVLASLVATVLLAGCAGTPLPALSSPVSGTSSVGLWIYGVAPENATVGPCAATATTIEVTTNSPNSPILVDYAKAANGGGFEGFQSDVIPAGTGTTSIDVPAGCYRVSLQSQMRYCDGTIGLGFPCTVVMPPTYRFTFTITF